MSLFSVHVGGFDTGNGHVAAEHIHTVLVIYDDGEMKSHLAGVTLKVAIMHVRRADYVAHC